MLIIEITPQRGFPDAEFFELRKLIDAAGILQLVCGPQKTSLVSLKGESYLPNMRLEEVRVNEYDGVVFIGCSPGFIGLENNPAAVKMAKDFFDAGKIVAASGTAVSLLNSAGIPKDSEKVLTSAGESEVKDFADKIIVLLGGKKPLLAEQVKQA
ncbi:MAG: DJ-1/PfpI family protein [Candidatus Aenigmarchaeota archaeon]|nr:DJ-1/PfpI family protein [Candidatus Aenigmarchaeota archaeon]